MRVVQDKTKNGSVLQEHDRSHRKELNKLEHQMQMAKVKLSIAKNENAALKTKVVGLRREKFLHLQISHDLVGALIIPYILQQSYYPILLPYYTTYDTFPFLYAATRGIGGPQESEAVPEGDHQHQ